MKDSTLRHVGKKIKEIRKGKNMSLQEVAEKSDVTAGLISKIENFRTIPSLPVLLNISRALDVHMSELVSGVDDENASYVLIRKNSGEIEASEDANGFVYQSLVKRDVGNVNFRVNIVSLTPNGRQKPSSSEGMELLYILNGNVVCGLNEDEITLNPGDTLFFDGSIPHSINSNGQKEALMLKIHLLKR